ncbi:hypothetical protein PCANC_01057 [Puccinia coronata f. sp. avenae]|uniref:Uncharacterized protein n=1 Tax=Puccinia coronata f. sp. avenae TaxID=200324 RepID=A0A2N5W6H4_9BASI|nr:hypothetical protein PCANC_01057 [Puccinia coronata f. sp. avenae]
MAPLSTTSNCATSSVPTQSAHDITSARLPYATGVATLCLSQLAYLPTTLRPRQHTNSYGKSSSTLPQENLSSQEDCDPSSSMNNGKPACKETPTSAPSHLIQANNLSTGLTNAKPRTANRVGLEEALSSFPSSSEQDIRKSAPSISLQSNPLSTGLVNSASKSIKSLPQLDISSAK